MRQPITDTLRSYPWRHQMLCLLPLVLLLLYLSAAVGTGKDVTLHFKEVKELHPMTTQIMRFLTNWTNIALYGVYAALFLHGLRSGQKSLVRFILVFTAVQIFVSAVLVQITKIVVGRPRPLLALEGFSYSPFSSSGAFHSFPSGHTSEISGAAFPLANWYRHPLFSLFLGLIVAVIGFSRIYLSMHHISDVAGGLVVGVFAGLLNHHLCSREQS